MTNSKTCINLKTVLCLGKY